MKAKLAYCAIPCDNRRIATNRPIAMLKTTFDLEALKQRELTADDFAKTLECKFSPKLDRKLKSGEVELADSAELRKQQLEGTVLVSKTQYLSCWKDHSYATLFTNPQVQNLLVRLTSSERSVLDWLIANTGYYNWQLYQRTVICEALGCNPSTVTRAIARLGELGIIKTQATNSLKAEIGVGAADLDMQRATYREAVWYYWGAQQREFEEAVPNRSSWLRISNFLLWKGQIRYMFEAPPGYSVENRSPKYAAIQQYYGQEPGILLSLMDNQKKGKAMQEYFSVCAEQGGRVLPEGRW